jgi:hypothetical protein
MKSTYGFGIENGLLSFKLQDIDAWVELSLLHLQVPANLWQGISDYSPAALATTFVEGKSFYFSFNKRQ